MPDRREDGYGVVVDIVVVVASEAVLQRVAWIRRGWNPVDLGIEKSMPHIVADRIGAG